MAVPADLTNKRIWLRAKDLGADGSSVATWPDQSGQANDATAPGTAPVVAAASTPSGGKSVSFLTRALNLTASPKVPNVIASAAASSEPAGASFNAAKAIDGSTATRWLGADPTVGSPQWLRLTLTSATVVTYYKIWGHSTSTAYNPTEWKFQGTNDGTFATWTDLDTRSGITWASASDTKEFTFANSTAYLYYRILITGNVSATDYVAISEITLTPPSVAELWVVIKAETATSNSTPWKFGNSSQATLYPWSSGQVVDNFAVSTHSGLFTPTVDISQWRLYRARFTNGQLDIWLDNTPQKTATGLTESWSSSPAVSVNFRGDIAELLVTYGDELTAGQVADLITYFNTEHGLTVPGGSAGGVEAPVLTATGDVPDPGIILGAPTLTGAGDLLDPAIVYPPITAPTLAGVGDVLDPALVVAAPTIPVVGAMPDPLIPGVAIAAPVLAGTGDLLDPEASVDGLRWGSALTSQAVTVAAQTIASGFGWGSSLASIVVSPQLLEGGFSFGSRLTQTRDWGVDPRSTRPSPRVVIAERDGTPVTALDQVEIGPVSWGVGVLDSWRFSVDRDDPRGKKALPVAREGHIYRGSVLMSKGPIGPGRLESGRMVHDCSDPRWYLNTGRFIGRIPRLNWCFNGDFSQGTAGWTGAYDAGSAPEAPPTFYVVEEAESTSGYGLRIEGVDKVVTSKTSVSSSAVFVPNSATYLSGGAAKIQAVGNTIPNGTDIHIVGHTANDGTGSGLALSLARAQAARSTLAAMGKGFTFSILPGLRTPNMNDGVVAGRGYYEPVGSTLAENRRVDIHAATLQTATGHKQYVTQHTHGVVQPVDAKVPLKVTIAGRMRIGEWLGAPADGWALWAAVLDSGNAMVGEPSTASMSAATPTQRWFDYSVEVEVPPDGQPYQIYWRLYPPAGWAVWTDVGVYPQEQLGFFDVDEALIVKGVTEHVQDPAFGHGDLGIGTRTPLTGVTRTKEYQFERLWPYSTVVEELVALAKGVEVDCEVTPTSATIVTHYPRQGSAAGLSLTHGGARSIVKAYRPLPAGTRGMASSLIVQSWGYSSNRIMQYARDETALGGTLLEAVVQADGESPPSELDELATQTLARMIHPTAAWEVTLDPARTSEVLDEIGKGDTVLLSLPDEDVHGLHRVVLFTWDPETDGLTLQLAPEEA